MNNYTHHECWHKLQKTRYRYIFFIINEYMELHELVILMGLILK